ncbi:unnamed protein product [marine sediment metagenome]|uniref:Uncharacterized protein n=1 Tax=marine sediment metagenome TaxID=412755 RepID=X1RUQ3_9ZZZZ
MNSRQARFQHQWHPSPGNIDGYDKLEGDWALYYKIARYFVHKVKFEDRQDFLHDLIAGDGKSQGKV